MEQFTEEYIKLAAVAAWVLRDFPAMRCIGFFCYSAIPNTKIRGNSMNCPSCNSERIDKKNYGKKVGTAVGGTAGFAGGATGATAGAEAGAALGIIGGPVGAIAGGFAGAIVGGLLGAVAGGFAGQKAGEMVDEHILDNYECLDCGHSFSK